MIILIVIVVFIAAGSAFFFMNARKAEGKAGYKTTEVVIGDIESVITCSGTLSPLTTVEVGTQISGIISEIYVDFNDKVEEGQLLARLDTLLLEASLMDAEASLERAEAQLELAQSDYDRNKPLYEKGLISEAEFLPYSIAVKTQKASLKSARASFKRASQNLQYAEITSPIAGKVIERNVEEGQTVAASFSTPTLFIIAEDLKQMEILAEVDESDIGRIKEGQSVKFDVQAYEDTIFKGVVKQVRLQPAVVSNVVTYTVIVQATNENELLLPGMTATVDFIIDQCKDALLAPNAALRFQPTQEMRDKIRERMESEREPMSDEEREKWKARRESRGRGEGERSGRGFGMGFGGGTERREDIKLLWFIDEEGNLFFDPVKTGMTDGSVTEIVHSRRLKKGHRVITGFTTDSDNNRSDGNRRQFRGGPPHRMF